MTPKTVFLVMHVISVAAGVGGVMMLDFFLFRYLRGNQVTSSGVALTHFISSFVKVGLVVIWASGIAILAVAPDGPASVLANPKVQAKLVIVVVLTLNALLIETLALPLLRRNLGHPLFHGVSEKERTIILGSGVVSSLSWLSPLVLGLAREFNHVVPALDILLVYLSALAVAFVLAQVLGRMLYRTHNADVLPEVTVAALTRGVDQLKEQAMLMRKVDERFQAARSIPTASFVPLRAASR